MHEEVPISVRDIKSGMTFLLIRLWLHGLWNSKLQLGEETEHKGNHYHRTFQDVDERCKCGISAKWIQVARNSQLSGDVGFPSVCCEYHWLIKELLWVYSRAVGEQS